MAGAAFASSTGSWRKGALALAIATASAAMRATVSRSTWWLAANPHAPLQSTRTPKPKRSSSVTDGTLLISPVVQSGAARNRTVCVR